METFTLTVDPLVAKRDSDGELIRVDMPYFKEWLDGGGVPAPYVESPQEQLAALDAMYPITQRNLRNLVIILADALKVAGVDLTSLKGYQTAKMVEDLAAPIRAQIP